MAKKRKVKGIMYKSNMGTITWAKVKKGKGETWTSSHDPVATKREWLRQIKEDKLKALKTGKKSHLRTGKLRMTERRKTNPTGYQKRHSGGSYSGGSMWGKDFQEWGMFKYSGGNMNKQYVASKKGISVKKAIEQEVFKKTDNFSIFD